MIPFLCRHYSGVLGATPADSARTTCKAGIRYVLVARRDADGQAIYPLSYPCFERNRELETCSLRSYWTAAERSKSENAPSPI